MELANSRFGSELRNNKYSNLTAAVITTGGKPKPKLGGTKPLIMTGTAYVGTGTPAPAPSGSTVGRPPIIVAAPIVDLGLPVVPVYSAPTPMPTTPSGSAGGSGGGSGSGSEESGSEKSAEQTEETKSPETATETKGVTPVSELSFFQKPVGKVTVFVAIAALLYGGYRLAVAKKLI